MLLCEAALRCEARDFPAQGFAAAFCPGPLARIKLSHDQESLKLEYRLVQAVLYSAFIHQEAVEHPCVREVLYGHTTESQIAVAGGRVTLGRVCAFEKDRLGKFGKWVGFIICVQGIDGLVLDAAGSFEPP